MKPIEYDKQGRMKYHPDFHAKRQKPWTNHEQAYLLAHYFTLGPEEVSLALERPLTAVMRKFSNLRAKGLAPADRKRNYHKRMMHKSKAQGVAA